MRTVLQVAQELSEFHGSALTPARLIFFVPRDFVRSPRRGCAEVPLGSWTISSASPLSAATNLDKTKPVIAPPLLGERAGVRAD